MSVIKNDSFLFAYRGDKHKFPILKNKLSDWLQSGRSILNYLADYPGELDESLRQLLQLAKNPEITDVQLEKLMQVRIISDKPNSIVLPPHPLETDSNHGWCYNFCKRANGDRVDNGYLVYEPGSWVVGVYVPDQMLKKKIRWKVEQIGRFMVAY